MNEESNKNSALSTAIKIAGVAAIGYGGTKAYKMMKNPKSLEKTMDVAKDIVNTSTGSTKDLSHTAKEVAKDISSNPGQTSEVLHKKADLKENKLKLGGEMINGDSTSEAANRAKKYDSRIAREKVTKYEQNQAEKVVRGNQVSKSKWGQWKHNNPEKAKEIQSRINPKDVGESGKFNEMINWKSENMLDGELAPNALIDSKGAIRMRRDALNRRRR